MIGTYRSLTPGMVRATLLDPTECGDGLMEGIAGAPIKFDILTRGSFQVTGVAQSHLFD